MLFASPLVKCCPFLRGPELQLPIVLVLYVGCGFCHSGQAGPGKTYRGSSWRDCIPQEDPWRGLNTPKVTFLNITQNCMWLTVHLFHSLYLQPPPHTHTHTHTHTLIPSIQHVHWPFTDEALKSSSLNALSAFNDEMVTCVCVSCALTVRGQCKAVEQMHPYN